MLSSKFGIEIEFTGITRQEAAELVSKYFDCEYYRTHDYYDSYIAKTSDGREWKLMYDSSITCRKREGRRSRPAGSEYACELVSPILTYHEDIGALQDIVRRLRKAGGMTNNSCVHTPLKKCSLTADDGALSPLKWCAHSAEMVHGGRERGAPGRHAGGITRGCLCACAWIHPRSG